MGRGFRNAAVIVVAIDASDGRLADFVQLICVFKEEDELPLADGKISQPSDNGYLA